MPRHFTTHLWPLCQGAPPYVRRNRQWLRSVMHRHGWRNLPEEWWHYTLVDEPYPQRYFTHPVR